VKKFPTGLFLISLVTLVLFARVTRFDFVNFDDPDLLTNHRWYLPLSFHSFIQMWNPLSFWNGVALDYSPLRDLTYAIDHLLWGWWPGGFHLTQVFLHIANTVLVALVLRHFLPEKRALLGAALWSWHPLTVEPVAWITGRKDLLMASFLLLGFLALLRHRYRWFLIFAICSMLSKPVGVAAGALGLFNWTSEKPDRMAQKFSVVVLAFGALLLGFVIATKLHLDSVIQKEGEGGFLQNWPAAFQVFSHAFTKFVAPTDLSARYIQRYDYTWSDIPVLAGIIFAALSVWASRTSKGALFFLIAFFFYCQILPVQIWTADRYLYLPLLGAIWGLLSIQSRAIPIFAMVAAGTFCWMTTQRLPVWKDSYALWSDTVRKSPGLYYAWGNLAAAEMEREIGSPVFHLERALKLNPDWSLGHLYLANALLTQGDLKNGKLELEIFERSASEALLKTHLGDRATAWAQLNKKEIAEKLFNQALESSRNPTTLANFGVLLVQSGREDQALKVWTEAIQARSHQRIARYNRARYYFFHKNCSKMTGDLDWVIPKTELELKEIGFMRAKCGK
jgi:protein O-mannosyl-transferase